MEEEKPFYFCVSIREPIFFFRYSRQHCEADFERETRAMHKELVLQAIKEMKNIK